MVASLTSNPFHVTVKPECDHLGVVPPLISISLPPKQKGDLYSLHINNREVTVRRAMTGLKVVVFDAAYADHFKRLNLVWLERYFQVEPIDLEVLSNPEERIIKRGGMIFFALLDGAVVGTCALIRHNDGLFELSKMAVADNHQGHGIGTQLLMHVIEWARSQSIQKVFVETNTVLERAVRLYQRVGFRAIAHDSSNAHYHRTNLKMELKL
jgi:GNAT superfamily N-acetyltransferase